MQCLEEAFGSSGQFGRSKALNLPPRKKEEKMTKLLFTAKPAYEAPHMEIITFTVTDVISCSGNTGKAPHHDNMLEDDPV